MTANISLLRIKDVKARVGLGVSTIYAMQAAGSFPKSITVLARHKAWPSNLIDDWIARQIQDDAARVLQ